MEAITMDNEASIIRNNLFLHNSLFQYDLINLIKKMKSTPGWRNGELVATVLLKSPGKQIILTILHDDTEIRSFQSGDSITFQVIEGRVKYHSREETVILENGQPMTLHNNIRFSLTSHEEESAFLLTIDTGSSVTNEN